MGGVGGGLMTSMRMRLVFSFCFLHLLVLFGGAVRLLLHFAQIDHAKTSSFCSFQDNNLKIAAQFPLKKTTKAWYLRHFRKNAA